MKTRITIIIGIEKVNMHAQTSVMTTYHNSTPTLWLCESGYVKGPDTSFNRINAAI